MRLIGNSDRFEWREIGRSRSCSFTTTLKTFNQQKGNTKLSCEIPFFHNLVVAVYAIFAR